MALSRRTSRPRYALLLLVLAAISIITLSFRGNSTGWLGGVRAAATDVFSPIQSAMGTIFDPVGNFFEGAADYGSLKSANARLKNEIASLKQTKAEGSLYESQLRQVAADEHLSFAANYKHVVTTVEANSASNFQDTIQLSKGSGSGIKVGMPAVTGSGLVGTVVQVSASRSTVQLITDPSTSVGVLYTTSTSGNGTSTSGNGKSVPGKGKSTSTSTTSTSTSTTSTSTSTTSTPGTGMSTNTTGLALATGQGTGKSLSVSQVPPGTKLQKGSLMVTSGASGFLYPMDIPVGTVATASLAPAATQDTVTLKPSVDFDRLEFVSVLLFKPSSAVP